MPESSLLAVEWYLPSVEVVPGEKAFRHVKIHKAVEPTARPLAESRKLYQSVIAQIALRTVREVFEATPEDTVSTVVFNGRVHAVDPLTGQKIQPHLPAIQGATRDAQKTLVTLKDVAKGFAIIDSVVTLVGSVMTGDLAKLGGDLDGLQKAIQA